MTASRPWILEVTAGGEDTVYDDHYAIGSGGLFAKLAMASVAHYDLRNRSMREAQVIAWRAIDTCITASAFGVGHPIRMCCITEHGGAAVTDDAALRVVEDTVNGWKQAEFEALKGLGLGLAPEPEQADPGLDPSES